MLEVGPRESARIVSVVGMVSPHEWRNFQRGNYLAIVIHPMKYFALLTYIQMDRKKDGPHRDLMRFFFE
jgi:hypothetical protein